MLDPAHMRRLMWYMFAGTKGGAMRIRIIEKLRSRPYNMHQLSKELKVDYRTIVHHMKLLLENGAVEVEGKRYGEMFFLTKLFESEMATFEEIANKLGTTNK